MYVDSTSQCLLFFIFDHGRVYVPRHRLKGGWSYLLNAGHAAKPKNLAVSLALWLDNAEDPPHSWSPARHYTGGMEL